ADDNHRHQRRADDHLDERKRPAEAGRGPGCPDIFYWRARGAGYLKSEARKPKDARIPKSEHAKPQSRSAAHWGANPNRPGNCRSTISPMSEATSGFGPRISDFPRFSVFGLRIWQAGSAGDSENSGLKELHSHPPLLLRDSDSWGRREPLRTESSGLWNSSV